MALEDAAALGIVFSKKYWRGNIHDILDLYERVRKPRATKVQEAAARARENIHERIGMTKGISFSGRQMQLTVGIGFSSNTTNDLYSVKDENKKLTIEEMNRYALARDINCFQRH